MMAQSNSTYRFNEMKVEMKTLKISDKTKDLILDTLKYLHGEDFTHREKSSYKDRRLKLDRQYWVDRGNLVVQGGKNFSKKENPENSGDYGNKFALSKLERYGFYKVHCEEALKIVSGDVGAAYELLMCRYFNCELPKEEKTPQNLLEERAQEFDSLKEIYGNCEETIPNHLWVFHMDLKYLADALDRNNSKKTFNMRRIKPRRDICRFYMRGNCRFGNNCRFSHVNPESVGVDTSLVDPARTKFDVEVRFPIGSRYPLEPPLISLISHSNEFPSQTCLRITNYLLKEVNKGAAMQQPTLYTIIDLLCNHQEEVLKVLDGPSRVFYDPTISLLPDSLNHVQNGSEINDVVDHLWASSDTKGMKSEYLQEQISKIDDELCFKFTKKENDSIYRKMIEKRKELPAWTKQDEIIDIIKNNQVVIVSGDTGCGKSTQVPQFLLDDWLLNRKEGQHMEIICTQPRRISAIGVAERVAAERNERMPDTIGYQIRLDIKSSQNTRLLYCTNGILLRRIESDHYLSNVTHVIVDEVHERSEESDLLLLILKDLLKQRTDLKIILMSATINPEIFSNYFEGAPLINIPGRTFPVEQLFLEDIIPRIDYNLEEYSQYAKKISKQHSRLIETLENENMQIYNVTRGVYLPDPEAPDEYLIPAQFYTRYKQFSRATCKTLYLMDTEKINFELILSLLTWIVKGEHDYPRQGSILVFLPGIAEIMTMYDQLMANSVFNSRKENQYFTLIPLHSTLTNEEQALIFRKPRFGERRIVLATNIAETSITIEDCVFVIDSGKMKEKRFDSGKNMESLETIWISRANAVQRKGRAGRVMAGVCFHLFTSHRFQVMLEPQPIPEICRIPLEQLVLRMKMSPLLAKVDLSSAIQCFIDAPPEANVQQAIKRLQDVGALNEEENLTPLGKHLAALPVDVGIGKLILSGAIFCALDSTLTMAACLSYKSPFIAPIKKKEEAAKKKKEFVIASSDHLTTLNAYKCWQIACNEGKHAGNIFANTNFLSTKTLTTLADIKAQLLELLVDIGFVPGNIRLDRRRDGVDRISEITGPELNANSNNKKLLAALLCAALYPNVVKVMTPNKHYTLSLAGALPTPLKPEELKFMTKSDGSVHIHPSSVNSDRIYYPSPYLVYQEKMKTGKVYLRDCTMVPCLSLVLFSSGKLKVELNYGQFIISVNEGWILFSVPSNEIAELLESMKNELQKLLEEKIQEPRLNLLTHPRGKRIISTIVHIISYD